MVATLQNQGNQAIPGGQVLRRSAGLQPGHPVRRLPRRLYGSGARENERSAFCSRARGKLIQKRPLNTTVVVEQHQKQLFRERLFL